jgi:hypothetical protein
LALLASGIAWRGSLSVNDGLALAALAFVSFVAASGLLFLGATWMAAGAFPVAFLIFMVPATGRRGGLAGKCAHARIRSVVLFLMMVKKRKMRGWRRTKRRALLQTAKPVRVC